MIQEGHEEHAGRGAWRTRRLENRERGDCRKEPVGNKGRSAESRRTYVLSQLLATDTSSSSATGIPQRSIVSTTSAGSQLRLSFNSLYTIKILHSSTMWRDSTFISLSYLLSFPPLLIFHNISLLAQHMPTSTADQCHVIKRDD